MKRCPREESENFCGRQRFSRADRASSEGITHVHRENDWWNERCVLFRTLLFSSSTAFLQSRRTIFAYCYLSYVKFILRHSLSYDKLHHKNRRPDFVRGGGFIMQGFADILPHSDTAEGEHNVPMCSGCGGRAFEPHCSAPRERHDESRVFLFSQIFHIPTWQVGNLVLQCLLIR